MNLSNMESINKKSGREIFQEPISKSPDEPLKLGAYEPSRNLFLLKRPVHVLVSSEEKEPNLAPVQNIEE